MWQHKIMLRIERQKVQETVYMCVWGEGGKAGSEGRRGRSSKWLVWKFFFHSKLLVKYNSVSWYEFYSLSLLLNSHSSIWPILFCIVKLFPLNIETIISLILKQNKGLLSISWHISLPFRSTFLERVFSASMFSSSEKWLYVSVKIVVDF